MYYLHYISWAYFDTLQASCTKGVIDSRRHPLFDGFFWANICAAETPATFSDCRYVDVIVEFVSLGFFWSQKLALQTAVSPITKGVWSSLLKLCYGCLNNRFDLFCARACACVRAGFVREGMYVRENEQGYEREQGRTRKQAGTFGFGAKL